MNFHIISLFPGVLDPYVNESILKRAKESNRISVFFYNPRDFSKDKHRSVDDKPYGGGPGMVIKADPVARAVLSAVRKADKLAKKKKPRIKKILLSHRGREFNSTLSSKLATGYTDIIIICGHYEGIDARVKKIFRPEEISIGPYILTGGELPALVIIDAVSRQLDGVLGNYDSLEERRVATSEVYTRPEAYIFKSKTYRVPKVLLSGDHKKIEEWKKERSK
jgi:tRNA (guanine37-N1)-methyltransferase